MENTNNTVKVGDKEFTIQEATFEQFEALKTAGLNVIDGITQQGISDKILKDMKVAPKWCAIVVERDPTKREATEKFLFTNAGLSTFREIFGFFTSSLSGTSLPSEASDGKIAQEEKVENQDATV